MVTRFGVSGSGFLVICSGFNAGVHVSGFRVRGFGLLLFAVGVFGYGFSRFGVSVFRVSGGSWFLFLC